MPTLILTGQILVSVAIVALVLFGLWVAVFGEARLAKAAEEAALQLGLKPEGRSSLREGWSEGEVHGGRVEGIRVRIGTGVRAVPIHGGRAAILMGAAVTLEAPEPAQFPYQLARKAGVSQGDLRHPDPGFDRRCALSSPEPASLLALLDDALLREQVARFLEEGQGSAFLDERGASLLVFGALATPEGILKRVRKALAVVQALQGRAMDLASPRRALAPASPEDERLARRAVHALGIQGLYPSKVLEVEVAGLPRQAEEAPCPCRMILAGVSYVEKRHPGMGSYYGFSGHFLSLLIRADDGKAWDARVEEAS